MKSKGITMLAAIVLSGALAAASPAMAIRPAKLRAPLAPNAPNAPPPECVTQTPIQPLLVPSWAFVMNFDVIRTRTNNVKYPVGCLVVWRAPINPTDYISIDTCDAFGPVSFAGGQGTFTGGDVRCPVNVQAALAALNPPVNIGAEEPYPPFEIVGMGDIRPPTTPHPYSNPIAYYQPDVAGALPVGLFVPAPNVNDVYTIMSYFNGVINLDGNIGFPAGLGAQTWSAKHQPMQGSYQVEHAQNWVTLSTFFPRPLVSLRTDGALIYVGGSPLGPGFDGVLDEVIVDPPDKAGPTSTSYASWLPIAIR